MKLIIAIIQPDRLQDVLDELEAAAIYLVTVSHVMGRGQQKGISQVYRSHIESGNLLKKYKLDIAVNDDCVDKTIAAIEKAACTGNIGDGKIFVLNLEECVRIRTSERGNQAISDVS